MDALLFHSLLFQHSIHSSSSTPHDSHLIFHTSSSTPHLPHLMIHTSSSTPHLPHLMIYTSSSTPHLPHLMIHTSSSTPHDSHLMIQPSFRYRISVAVCNVSSSTCVIQIQPSPVNQHNWCVVDLWRREGGFRISDCQHNWCVLGVCEEEKEGSGSVIVSIIDVF